MVVSETGKVPGCAHTDPGGNSVGERGATALLLRETHAGPEVPVAKSWGCDREGRAKSQLGGPCVPCHQSRGHRSLSTPPESVPSHSARCCFQEAPRQARGTQRKRPPQSCPCTPRLRGGALAGGEARGRVWGHIPASVHIPVSTPHPPGRGGLWVLHLKSFQSEEGLAALRAAEKSRCVSKINNRFQSSLSSKPGNSRDSLGGPGAALDSGGSRAHSCCGMPCSL